MRKGSRCSSLWLLAPATRTSADTLQDLPSADARSGAFPFTSGLKLIDGALRCLAKPGLRCGVRGNDGYTRKNGWGRVKRIMEAGGLGVFSFSFVFPTPLSFYPPPRCVVCAVAERPFFVKSHSIYANTPSHLFRCAPGLAQRLREPAGSRMEAFCLPRL